jgi:hypothetical protein
MPAAARERTAKLKKRRTEFPDPATKASETFCGKDWAGTRQELGRLVALGLEGVPVTAPMI